MASSTSTPKFQPTLGYVTEEVQKAFTRKRSLARSPSVKSLVANPDPSSPLYIWQVYSLAGEVPTHNLVRDFYSGIFSTKSEFSAVFEEGGDIDYHTGAQSSYWLDVMGGGKRYEGGHPRMLWSHKMGAKKIMNETGAQEWMKHMRATLLRHKSDLDQVDIRIFPCVVEFLKFKMQGYAVEHSWEFDPTDFDAVENLQEKEEEDDEDEEEDEGAGIISQYRGVGGFLLSCFERKKR